MPDDKPDAPEGAYNEIIQKPGGEYEGFRISDHNQGGYEITGNRGEHPKIRLNRSRFRFVRSPDSTEDEEIVEIVPKFQSAINRVFDSRIARR